MRRSSTTAMGVIAALVLSFSALAASPAKTGEVIVKYKQGLVRTNLVMNELYRTVGVEKVRYFSETAGDVEHLILESGITTEQALERLNRSKLVEYAHPNYILSIPEYSINDRLKERVSEIPCVPGTETIGCNADLPIPCIPGIEIPGCDPNAKLPCIFPGIDFPPGCEDSDGGGGGGGEPPPSPPPSKRPELKEPPALPNPPVADPNLSKAWGITKIQAPDAWKIHSGSKSIVVAVIDTGVDYNHEDLSNNMWRNPNPTKGDIVGFDFIHNDGIPYDDQGHGTHTSGSVGATGNNGIGIAGVAPMVSIMGLKFLSSEGSGTTADAIKAIDYAVENGAKILSNSWGGPSDPGNQALYESIERAKAKGVLFIAAAGNSSKNNDVPSQASYPAAFDNDNLIAVAATDSGDGMAFFSNYGKVSTDLGAPGASVYSTIPGNKYQSNSGTSMACPHVAGAAALLWSHNPTWDYKKVKEVLLCTVDKVSSLNGKTVTGGRLNILKALQTKDCSGTL